MTNNNKFFLMSWASFIPGDRVPLAQAFLLPSYIFQFIKWTYPEPNETRYMEMPLEKLILPAPPWPWVQLLKLLYEVFCCLPKSGNNNWNQKLCIRDLWYTWNLTHFSLQNLSWPADSAENKVNCQWSVYQFSFRTDSGCSTKFSPA